MGNLGKSFLAVMLVFLVGFSSFCNDDNDNASPGNIYYVSVDGDDSYSGTRENPWKTPGYGSRQLEPGDTLVILGGRYSLKEYDADILIPQSGTEEKTITIKGEDDHRPVLAGSQNLSHALSLSSNLVVENLEITSDNGALFRDAISQVDNPVSNVTIRNVFIHHIDEFGIDIADVNNLTVQDCTIHYTGFGSIGGPEGQSGGWRNVVIDTCVFSFNGHYYQGGDGPGPYDRPDGLGIEYSEGPLEIKNCTVEHNRGDGLDSKVANTYIHHCLVANNSCDGIKLWAGNSKVENCLIYGTGDGVGGASPWAGMVIDGDKNGDQFEIINVTIHDNPARQAYPLYAGYDQQADITVTMKNCIISNGYGPVYFGPRVTPVIEFNGFFRPFQDIQVEANGRTYSIQEIMNNLLGEGNRVGNPLFISPAWGTFGDYHLQSGSLAIDSGTSVGAPADDLDYQPRPKGNGYDMGAYEQ